MNHDEAKKLLLEKGYKLDTTMNLEQDSYYYYKRIQGATDCKLNKRSPSIGVTIYETNHNNIEYLSMKINLRAEALSGDWVDVGYYSLALDRLEDLSTFEFTIAKQWEIAN